MKIYYSIILILFCSCSVQKDISGTYIHNCNDKGFRNILTLDLRPDSTYSYVHFKDQLCYFDTLFSEGTWKVNDGILDLIVAEDLTPNIEILKDSESDRAKVKLEAIYKEPNVLMIQWRFFDKQGDFIHSNRWGSEVEVERRDFQEIEFNYNLKFKIDYTVSKIVISNLYEKVIYNMKPLRMRVKKNKLITVSKIYSPVGKKIKGIFKKQKAHNNR